MWVSQRWPGPPLPPEVWVRNGLIRRCISVALGMDSGSCYDFFLTVVDKMEAGLCEEGVWTKKGVVFLSRCWTGGSTRLVRVLGEQEPVSGVRTVQWKAARQPPLRAALIS